MLPRDLLPDLLETIQRVTGADQVSILLHMEPADRDAILVASRDTGAAVPEFAGEAEAWAFVSGPGSSVGGDQPIATLPSADPGGVLIRVSAGHNLARPSSERRAVDERRREPDVRTAPPDDGAIWIGLRGGRPREEIVAEFAGDAPEGAGAGRPGLLTTCIRLAWSVYHMSRLMHDPISELPGRMELRVFLRRAAAAGAHSGQPIGLMLVNPDDFTMINHRHGRHHGDLVVRDLGVRIGGCLRQTDRVFHYGGAVFAAVLPATDLDQCRAVADKVRADLTSARYLDGEIALTFSIGAAVAAPGEGAAGEPVDELLSQRANAALNGARMSGGARAVVIGIDDEDPESTVLNPLRGIFAADTEKDYRNMLLLWETVALISTQAVPEAIAQAFVDRLAIGFRPERVALVSDSEGTIEVLASNVRDDTAADGRASGRPLELDGARQALIREALETGRVARARSAGNGPARSAYAVPLVARGARLACLYLDSRGTELQLDSSDVVFLNALATQMAIAIDRAELVARRIHEQERERRSLREEVRELRQALHHTKMVYQSAEMHGLMETLRRVAPTDATVLIVGESGTGKEMLAISLHELSDRRDQPFIVFDCGAVAESLIEAELFGHLKGAFTGADRAAPGHIAQADGGTLFLDEIGELPLAVQAKLLRFVQEKQYSPLGSAERRQVDVRIVAATNRDLSEEVACGRFRADLYYRLRVIALEAIPLRQRPDDILPLARYFLEKYATQQGAAAHRFSAAAERRLLGHHWAGNVRELQHCVLRAVLTHDAEMLDAAALELCPEPVGRASVPRTTEPIGTTAAPATPPPRAAASSCDRDPWAGLQRELERQVSAAVDPERPRPAPIGRWLSEDLVLAANEACGNVARRAAQVVSIPETTFRRQLEAASSGSVTGTDYRPAGWESIRPLIRRVVEHARSEPSTENLLSRARDELLACVQARTETPTIGASLMGVTPPTYRRWLQARGHQNE